MGVTRASSSRPPRTDDAPEGQAGVNYGRPCRGAGSVGWTRLSWGDSTGPRSEASPVVGHSPQLPLARPQRAFCLANHPFLPNSDL